MKETITIRDKNFTLYITNQEINEKIKHIAGRITKDYYRREPVFLAVLNGSFIFASDLLKEIDFPCEITFVKLQSYSGVQSTDRINVLIGLNGSLKNRDVIILEDIIDTGKTISTLMDALQKTLPKSISIATLLYKKSALTETIKPDYIGFEVKNKFLVGYGLDYDQQGRNLADIYAIL